MEQTLSTSMYSKNILTNWGILHSILQHPIPRLPNLSVPQFYTAYTVITLRKTK